MSYPIGLSPWDALGVPIGASRDEILKAYRKQMRHLHPDKKGGDVAKAQWLNEVKDDALLWNEKDNNGTQRFKAVERQLRRKALKEKFAVVVSKKSSATSTKRDAERHVREAREAEQTKEEQAKKRGVRRAQTVTAAFLARTDLPPTSKDGKYRRWNAYVEEVL